MMMTKAHKAALISIPSALSQTTVSMSCIGFYLPATIVNK